MIPKFRAWDKRNNKMVTNFSRSRMKIEGGKVMYQLVTSKDNRITAIASYNTQEDKIYRFSHELELMQATGLKDKNGVEIYVGDIADITDYKNGNEFRGAISFKNGSYVVESNIATHYRFIDYDIEIIGDIYQNPELLEGE